MVRLRVLGVIELQDAEGRHIDAVLAQPKRLAFLVYLALSHQRYHRREALLALFWPELDDARARDALNSTVRFLRRSIGAPAIVSRGPDEIGVDPAQCWCDAAAFREHADAGRAGEALELYEGDLVVNAFASESRELEEWLDRERAALRARAARAARSLAELRERQENFTTAVSVARRAVELSDADERVVRELLELLDRLGDRAGAVHAYDEFAARLARDFDTAPAPETTRVIERIRARSTSGIPSVAPPPVGPGRELNGWVIIRELGTGGMSHVYLAHDAKHDRHVALKMMRPELALTLGADRFLREIQITARLAHPHILPLIDSGNADGVIYLVTPYVPGESLRARLTRERRLPVPDAVRITSEVAEALDYAHRSGIIHRDIKPENILLADGHAIVADFGVARAVLASDPRSGDSDEAQLVGSPHYMSPEASSGKRVDARTDIYSLGRVLAEMLTGESGTAAVPQTVPEPLRALIADCLEPRSEDRPATAADVLRRLNAIGGYDVATAQRRAPRRPRLRRALIGSAVTIGVLSAYTASQRNVDDRFEIESTSKLTATPGLELDPSISPDGRLIAYAAGTAGSTQINVRQLNGGSVVEVTKGAQDAMRHHRWPAWSPDGSQIAYIASNGDRRPPTGRVYVVPALGGSPRLIADGLEYFATPVWSPDGRSIAYSAVDSIIIHDIESRSSRVVQTPPVVHSLAWSPDGRHLAFVAGNPGYTFATTAFGNVSPTSIWTVTLDGSQPTQVTPGRRVFLSPTWTPDSRGLLYVSNDGGAFDVHSIRLDAAARPLDEPRRLTTGLNVHGISLSRDGTRLAYSVLNARSNIYSAPIDPKGPTPVSAIRAVTDENETIETTDVSWDGKWLVFDSNRDGRFHIYKMPVAGGDPIRLTSDTTDDFAPKWSPDGRFIAFHSRRANPRTRDVYVMNADGRDIVQVSTDTLDESYPRWSPDGRSLFFPRAPRTLVASRRRDDGTWSTPSVVNVPGGGATNWTRDGKYLLRHQPDGLAAISVSGDLAPVVKRSDLRGPVLAMATGPNPRDVYIRTMDSSGVHAFYLAPIGGGPLRLLLRVEGTSRHASRVLFSTDGKRLFFTMTEAESDLWVMALER